MIRGESIELPIILSNILFKLPYNILEIIPTKGSLFNKIHADIYSK